MVTIRTAKPADVPGQREVWTRCFGDGPEFLDLFYGTYYEENETVVLLEEGVVSSMTALLPMELRLPDGSSAWAGYVYALATDPETRGKGFARSVLEYTDAHLQKEGRDCVTLVPASPSLHRFFARSNYEECFATRMAEVRCSDLPVPNAADCMTPISPGEYNAIRNRILDGQFYVRYDDRMIAFQRDTCHMSGPGGDLYRVTVDGAEGCAAVERHGKDRAVVKELLIDPGLMERAAARIAAAIPTASLQLRTPAFWEDLRIGETVPFGMIKWYRPDLAETWGEVKNAYMGFGFD